MGLLTAAAIVGVGLAAGGAITSYSASKASAKAQQQQIAAYQESERIKQRAMEIDADRRRRQLIRQSVIAKSQALTRGTQQGANAQASSALPGAYGQILGNLAFGAQGVNLNEQLGGLLFGANSQMLAAKSAEASAQSDAAFGKGLSSLGGALLGNLGAINSIGGNLAGGFSNVANYGSWSGSGFGGSGAPLG